MSLYLTKLFKNPIIIILLILALFSFFGSLMLIMIKNSRQVKPQSLPFPTFSSDVDIKFKYSFSGQMPQLASKQTIYQTSNTSSSLSEQIISQYGIEFGFDSQSKFVQGVDNSVYLFKGENTSLSISTNPASLRYGNYIQTPNNRISLDKYLSKARDFLENKQLVSKVWSLDNGYVQPVSIDPQGIAIPISDFNKAKYIELKFNYLLDKLSLIDKLHRDYPVQILLNLDGTVRKATILLPPSNIESLGSADTTLPQQALEAINNGQGTFSRLNNPEVAYTEIKQGDMSNATFNTVELVYVYDYDTGSIQPFYRFQGYGYTKDGDKIEVGVIITALPQELYQK